MKRLIVLMQLLFLFGGFFSLLEIGSQLLLAQEINYDEEKVTQFDLPNPLAMQDGSLILTASDWTNKRRPELLSLFKSEMFGQMPGVDRSKLKYETLLTETNIFEGKATRKQIRIFLNYPEERPRLDLLVYIPNKATQPVPAFLGFNFQGNHTTTDDPAILLTENADRTRNPNEDPETKRGIAKERWPFEMIINGGYAIATGYYEDIDPDFDDGFNNGVHSLFSTEFPNKENGDYPATITAWAWGLSRALDCLETIPEIDTQKVIVFGHSRLGKTALWAGATEERFAAVISNNSGCGGAALSRREYGETVARINKVFPHWFCQNFKKYGTDVNSLPFDQHELIALIAPRPVYIASAEEDRWADPRGEWLAAMNADIVYKLLGTEGILSCSWPELNQPIGKTIRYHIRTGKHNITEYDWQQYIKFADDFFRSEKRTEPE
ncbi:MAG: acetylxylan esterase [Planctomycetia bacterium]|nr:acetylxylan esterase [Planctomycetia bacterium]